MGAAPFLSLYIGNIATLGKRETLWVTEYLSPTQRLMAIRQRSPERSANIFHAMVTRLKLYRSGLRLVALLTDFRSSSSAAASAMDITARSWLSSSPGIKRLCRKLPVPFFRSMPSRGSRTSARPIPILMFGNFFAPAHGSRITSRSLPAGSITRSTGSSIDKSFA